MRHHEQAAAPPLPAGLEVVGEPVDGAHVQMVGGLVEHENVVIADEQAREVHAAALTAGELAHQALPRHVGNQAVQDLAHARARGPLVLGDVAHHGAVHGAGAVERVALAQHAHGHVAAARHAARVGLKDAGKHGQQARLAVAVLAHDADAVALVDAQGDVLRDQLGGKFQMHAVATQQNGHKHMLLALVFTAIHLSRVRRSNGWGGGRKVRCSDNRFE